MKCPGCENGEREIGARGGCPVCAQVLRRSVSSMELSILNILRRKRTIAEALEGE